MFIKHNLKHLHTTFISDMMAQTVGMHHIKPQMLKSSSQGRGEGGDKNILQ
jgi:hypothetical protein